MAEQEKTLVEEFNATNKKTGWTTPLWKDFRDQCEVGGACLNDLPVGVLDFGGWLMEQLLNERKENQSLRDDLMILMERTSATCDKVEWRGYDVVEGKDNE